MIFFERTFQATNTYIVGFKRSLYIIFQLITDIIKSNSREESLEFEN